MSDSDHETVATILPTSSGDTLATTEISGTSVLCSAYDTVINVRALMTYLWYMLAQELLVLLIQTLH